MEINEINNLRSLKNFILISVVCSAAFFVALFITFSVPSLATPTLYNPSPQNATYLGGGDKNLSVSVSDENLDESTVALHIKSSDATSWDAYSMSCILMNETTWKCQIYGVTISLDIVGSDTKEVYYFDANDTLGNKGSLGTATDPLFFIVDINPPVINFASPTNNSYIGDTEEIRLTVTDVSSGVNESTVEYSFDNATWLNTTLGSASTYTATWNVSSLANNQSVVIYAKASDKINNTGYKTINVFIDNEQPQINITNPSQSGPVQNVSGIISLQISVKDAYSGLDSSSIKYNVEGYQRSMNCVGNASSYTCDEYFDTRLVSDGLRTINFSATDNAGNTNYSTVQINVDNKEVAASITNPAGNSYIALLTYVNATVTNALGKATGVKVKISGASYSVLSDMSCSADYKCYYAWNTSAVSDGAYTILVNVTNNLGKLINSSISVTADNTKPTLVIDSPSNTTLNGVIYPKVIVTDGYGVDENSIKFNISNRTAQGVSCARHVQGKQYVCGGVLNTSLLDDNYYNLVFYAKDLAENWNSTSMLILVDNIPSVGPSANATSTTSIASTTTTTTSNATGGTPTTTGGTATTAAAGETTSTIGAGGGGILVVFGNLQKTISNILEPWPLKVLALGIILMAILMAIIAVYRATHKKLEKLEEIEEGGKI